MEDADRIKIKDKILGKNYELSLVFTNPKLSRKLNRIYRGKDKPANVLAFPISKHLGEIFIDLKTAKKEAGNFGMNFKKFVSYLFIHALLHLKGMSHSSKMNKAENKFLSQLINGTTNRSRH